MHSIESNSRILIEVTDEHLPVTSVRQAVDLVTELVEDLVLGVRGVGTVIVDLIIQSTGLII